MSTVIMNENFLGAKIAAGLKLGITVFYLIAKSYYGRELNCFNNFTTTVSDDSLLLYALILLWNLLLAGGSFMAFVGLEMNRPPFLGPHWILTSIECGFYFSYIGLIIVVGSANGLRNPLTTVDENVADFIHFFIILIIWSLIMFTYYLIFVKSVETAGNSMNQTRENNFKTKKLIESFRSLAVSNT